MSEKNVRLGIIGLGAQGGMYAGLLTEGKIAGMTLGAIADTDPAKKEVAGEKFPDVPFYDDYVAMLDSGDVDEQGALVLRGAPAWMTVRVHDEMQGGDHDLALLEVLEIDSTPAAPAMVFHRSRLKGLVEGDIAC